MNKILILGSSGFTAVHLRKYLSNALNPKDFAVTGYDAVKNNTFNINDTFKQQLITKENIGQILKDERPDYIFNLTGTLTGNDPAGFIEANALLTQALCEAVIKNNITVKKMLFVGSAAEYGIAKNMPVQESAPLNPITAYGLSKAVQTQILRYYYSQYSLPVVIARTFNVIGFGVSPLLSIGAFYKKIIETDEGGYINVGNISPRRDFIDIDDVVNAYWALITKHTHSLAYNVATGKPTEIRQLLDMLMNSSKKYLNYEIDPALVKKNEVSEIYADISLIKKDTGWHPRVALEDSVDKMFAEGNRYRWG